MACTDVVYTREMIDQKKENPVSAAQKIGNLWRIYLTDPIARVKLLSCGITLREQQVELKDQNPFRTPGFESIETTRLFVRNVPLSFDNNAIIEALQILGVTMVNTMKEARARDPQGKLTNFKTGDRFVDIVVPDEPLQKKLEIGAFTASLYHKEQRNADKECGNCMMRGHLRKNCPNEVVCYDCRNTGHKKGDPECPSVKEIMEAVSEENEKDESKSDGENDDDDDEDKSESEDETDKQERRMKQVFSEAFTLAEDLKSRSKDLSNPKSSTQTMMEAFLAGNLKPSRPGSRSVSPATRRKLADISPGTDKNQEKKGKINKKT